VQAAFSVAWLRPIAEFFIAAAETDSAVFYV
jgi:hypothetical protein